MVEKRLFPNTKIQSTWQYGEDGELRQGILPCGWNEDCNEVRWDDSEIEYVDRADFRVVKE